MAARTDKEITALQNDVNDLKRTLGMETQAREGLRGSYQEQIDALRAELTNGIKHEGQLREGGANALQQMLAGDARRIEYLEAVLGGGDEYGPTPMRTPTGVPQRFSAAHSVTGHDGLSSPAPWASFGTLEALNPPRRVVTLQHRLDLLERRMMAEVGRQSDLHEEALERERTDRDTRVKEETAKLARDMETSKSANAQEHHSMKDQIEALKASHDTHRSAITDSIAFEKSAREEAINDLKNHVTRRMNEEKANREKRDAFVQENLESRFASEKGERETGLRSCAEQLAAERSKRESQSSALQDAVNGDIAEERKAREAADAELRAAIGREKEAREAHKTAVQTLHEEASAARDLHAKEVHGHLETHRSHHAELLTGEQAARDAQAKDMYSNLDNKIKALQDKLHGFSENFAEEAGRHGGIHQAELAKLRAAMNEEKAIREKQHGATQELLDDHGERHGRSQEEVAKLSKDLDALRGLHDAHKSATADAISQEKSARDGALEDLQGHLARRLEEEKAHREKRETYLQDTFTARLAEEKGERETGFQTVGENLNTERLKRDKQLAAMQDATTSGLEEERKEREAADAELRAGLAREKEAREAHRAAVQGLHEEANAAREAHAKDLHGKLDSHRAQHKELLDTESSARNSVARELSTQMDTHNKGLKDELADLKRQLGVEKELRDGHHANLQATIDGLRKDLTGEMKRAESLREADHAKLNGLLSDEKSTRETHHANLQEMLQSEGATRAAHGKEMGTKLDNQHKSIKDMLDSVRQELLEDIKREESLREMNARDLRGLLASESARLEYVEAVLGEAEIGDFERRASLRDAGSARNSNVGLMRENTESESSYNPPRRIVTVQQRLEGLEKRLHAAIGRESESREEAVDKERSERAARMKEEMAKLTRDMEDMKQAHAKLIQDLDQQGRSLNEAFNRELAGLKNDLVNEKSHRTTAEAVMERELAALKLKMDEDNETHANHRQRHETALATHKKDHKDKHDLTMEKIGEVESRICEMVPVSLAELKETHGKVHQNLKDQIEALKAAHDTHRGVVDNTIASERSMREGALHDVQGHVQRRHEEEKAHRDAREAFIEETFAARLAAEKADRDATLRSLSESISGERAKRDAQIQAAQEATTASIAEEHKEREAALAELRAALAREREAREAGDAELKAANAREKEAREEHRAAVQALHEESTAAHHSHVRDLHGKLDSHKAAHQDALVAENASRKAHVSEMHEGLANQLQRLQDEIDALARSTSDKLSKESRAREAEMADMQDIIGGETLARESLEATTKEVADGQQQILRRLNEETSQREKNEAAMQDGFGSRLAAEKEERTSALQSITEGLVAERTKREKQVSSVQSALEGALAEEREEREAGDAELKGALGREKKAREEHRAAVQTLHEEHALAQEAHAREVHGKIDDHRNHHQALLEAEGSARQTSTRDLGMQLDNHHRNLKDLLANEGATRDQHVRDLHSKLEGNHEHLQGEHARLHRDVADDRQLRDDQFNYLKGELAKHQEYGTERLTEELAKLARQIEMMKSTHASELAEEKAGREVADDACKDDIADIQDVLGSERMARENLNADIQAALDKERQDREAEIEELKELLGAERTARENHHSAIKDLLNQERMEREEMINTERMEREAEISEMQEIIGDEELAREGHQTALKEMLDKHSGLRLSQIEDRLDSLRADLTSELAKEAELRQGEDKHLRQMIDAEASRLDILEYILGLGDLPRNTDKERFVSTLTDRLCEMEERLRGELAGLHQAREADKHHLEGRLGAEASARDMEQRKIREQLEKERADREARIRKEMANKDLSEFERSMREEIERLWGQMDTMKVSIQDDVETELQKLRKGLASEEQQRGQLAKELEQMEKTMNGIVAKEIAKLEHDLNDEEAQRTELAKEVERLKKSFETLKASDLVRLEGALKAEESHRESSVSHLRALIDGMGGRMDIHEESNSSHHLRHEGALNAHRDDTDSRHNHIVSRVDSLESHIAEMMPAAMREVRDADGKAQSKVRDQFQQMKDSLEECRATLLHRIDEERSHTLTLVQSFEDSLREGLSHEKKAREVGDENGHAAQQEQLASERKMRQGEDEELHNQIRALRETVNQMQTVMNEEVSRHGGLREDIYGHLEAHRFERESHHASVQERLEYIEGLLQSAADQHEAMEQKLHQEITADVCQLRELIGNERRSREGQNNALKELLEKEKAARIADVNEVRELAEFQRKSVQNAFEEVRKSLKEMSEDRQRVRALMERVEAMEHIVKERFPHLENALKALDMAHEQHEAHLASQTEAAAREREAREKSHRLLSELLGEQRVKLGEGLEHESASREKNQAALSESVDLLNELLRNERADRQSEVLKLWRAIDTHTHDLNQKEEMEEVVTTWQQTPKVSTNPAPVDAIGPVATTPSKVSRTVMKFNQPTNQGPTGGLISPAGGSRSFTGAPPITAQRSISQVVVPATTVTTTLPAQRIRSASSWQQQSGQPQPQTVRTQPLASVPYSEPISVPMGSSMLPGSPGAMTSVSTVMRPSSPRGERPSAGSTPGGESGMAMKKTKSIKCGSARYSQELHSHETARD
eukprot:TRINITY_DN13342_c1_g3_i1.p1 TRINITY_DN13342_c1_g3~~TRINITY_DN13342_c1_g3_i1.p1  ORF type:complete len:2940 (-),score=760.24 TRINITY_DN13342_c1_g3_i1:210-7973(-)